MLELHTGRLARRGTRYEPKCKKKITTRNTLHLRSKTEYKKLQSSAHFMWKMLPRSNPTWRGECGCSGVLHTEFQQTFVVLPCSEFLQCFPRLRLVLVREFPVFEILQSGTWASWKRIYRSINLSDQKTTMRNLVMYVYLLHMQIFFCV